MVAIVRELDAGTLGTGELMSILRGSASWPELRDTLDRMLGDGDT